MILDLERNKNNDDEEDEKGKTISVLGPNNKMRKVWAQKFTDDDLNHFIQDYIRRKKEEDDGKEVYSSIFHTTISSIKSAKDFPREFIHVIDKEERYLENYEKQRKSWKQNTISLSQRAHNKFPENSVMRRSDAFSEMQLIKQGSLTNDQSNYKSMNSWYSSLRKAKGSEEMHSNFIQRNTGLFPIYIHETCQNRQPDIIKRPKDLELFQNHNIEIPCLKHLKTNRNHLESLKTVKRISSMEDLIIKGNNKFE